MPLSPAALAHLLATARPIPARVADRIAPVAAGIPLVAVPGGFVGKRIVRRAA